MQLCNKFKVPTSRLFTDEDYLGPYQTPNEFLRKWFTDKNH